MMYPWMITPQTVEPPSVGEDVAAETHTGKVWARPKDGAWRELTPHVNNIGGNTDEFTVSGPIKVNGIPKVRMNGSVEQWEVTVAPTAESTGEFLIGNVTKKEIR